MKYQYVIWDFNGTLLDDVKLCFDLLNNPLLLNNHLNIIYNFQLIYPYYYPPIIRLIYIQLYLHAF
jgi:hypothetical protein